MKIVFTGGGTAGHLFPIVAINREIIKNHPQNNLSTFYIGPRDGFSADLFSKEGITVRNIFAGKIRRYFSLKDIFRNIADVCVKIPAGVFQSFYFLFVISPDLIFSKGGYGSLPVVIVGWLLRIPIFLHESDVCPGLANRIAGKFAVEIFTAFPVIKTLYFPKKKMVAVGNPLRKEIITQSVPDANKVLGLSGEKPVILFIGGSQGAQKINDLVLLVLPEILKSFEVVHQTGAINFKEVAAESAVVASDFLKKYYHPFPFLAEKELICAYRTADFIVSRGGAGSIFEIAAVGKPSIIVPLPKSAQKHQLKNAYAFSEEGACIVMEEPNFTPHFFLERLRSLFSEPEKLRAMAAKAREFSKPEAARIIAEYLIAYLTQ